MRMLAALSVAIVAAALATPVPVRAAYTNQTLFYDGFEGWSSSNCGYVGWTSCGYGDGVIQRDNECDAHNPPCSAPYAGNYHLKFENHDSPSPGLVKSLDLSGCNKAYVNFAWAKYGIGSGQYGRLNIKNGSTYVVVFDSGTGTAGYSVSSYELKSLGITLGSSVAFNLTSLSGGSSDEFYVDEFRVLCEAPQCGDGACEAPESCASCAQDCASPEGPSYWNCADLADNDCDGQTDCSDPGCLSEPGCAPSFTSFSFTGTMNQMNVNWNTEYSGSTSVKVECTLNGAQQCAPYPYVGQPGAGSCSVSSPAYVMTPDASLPRTAANTLSCAAYDAYIPTQRYEKTVRFYPISIEVAVPSSLSAVVGESQNLQISVKNNGTLSDTYHVSVSSTNPTLLDVNNGEQTSQTLGTNDVQQIYAGLTLLSAGQPATANLVVSSDSQAAIHFDMPVSVKGTEKSLPEFDMLGVLQIMAVSAVLLASFLF